MRRKHVRKDAVQLEETRLQGIENINDYPAFHERHRIFPAVFENRQHKKILDIAAGVGVVGRRIIDNYEVPGGFKVLCNDICPTCLKVLAREGLRTTSFNIDEEKEPFPFPDGSFDTIIALATIEHIINIDHFISEIYRLLDDDGYLYLSAPNYSGLTYLLPMIFSGKTFHDPMAEDSRYEFYAHVRYFTYRTLCELVSSFGFTLDTVYIGVPKSSSHYMALYSRSKFKAFVFRTLTTTLYTCFSPRWAAEPVLCFRKSKTKNNPSKLRKILL
jgi:2-polyprenyl-3-methyl-5-hydroxy-6-metoxy-1,4-benzoquinol methylase